MANFEINPRFCTTYLEHASKNALSTFVVEFPNKLVFHIDTLMEIFRRSNVTRLTPDPYIYIKHIYGDDLAVADFEEFKEIISRNNHGNSFCNKLINLCKKFNDFQIIEKIRAMGSITNHEMFIRLLYFLLFSNSVSFNEYCICNNFEIWSIQNSPEKEREFVNIPGPSMKLFHGTPTFNIYSIMRNGIRNMTNTIFQINASSQTGAGIYGSDSLSYAYSYSGYSRSCKNYIFIMIGKNVRPYINNEFIMQTDRDIMIVGFIVISEVCVFLEKNTEFCENVSRRVDRMLSQNSMSLLKNVYSEIPAELIHPDPFENRIRTSRIRREIQNISNPSSRSKYLIGYTELDESNPKVPLELLIMPDDSTPLWLDLMRYDIPGIRIITSFPVNFPFEPFTFRVISPIFLAGSGHIENGAICSNNLFQNGWSAATTLNSSIDSIACLISSEGEYEELDLRGKVDPKRLGQEYSYQDYISGRGDIALQHNWQK